MYDIHTQSIWFNAYVNSFNIQSRQLFPIEFNNNTLHLCAHTKKFNPFVSRISLTPLAQGANDFFLLGTHPHHATAAAYADNLFQRKKEWDQLVLSEVPATDFFVNALAEQLQQKGFQLTRDESRSFYHIDLTQNWDAYYKNYVHKKILDLRTRINKLKREGFDYTVSTLYTGIAPYLNSILDFYEERRKHTGQPNAFSNPLHAHMLREIIPAYEKMGWMKLSILNGSDGKDWAYQLDFVKDGIQYHYAPTFDMKYAAYSPSKILLFESIKNGFADQGMREFNFMRGESDYKKQFAYTKTPFVNLTVTNPYSIRNKIYNVYNKFSYLKLAFQKLTK